MTDTGLSAHLDWAESYPFDQPQTGYCFIDGRVLPEGEGPREGWAVLAAGSNASPSQLRRKFGVRNKPVRVSPVYLRDWAIVYSAHFAAYGSIPATLEPCPGAVTAAFVTWLDEADLRLMHQSEALGINYDYIDGEELCVVDVLGRPLAVHGFYRSRPGCLRIGGRPVRMAMAISTGVHWPALTQRSLLRYVARQLLPQSCHRTFLTRIIDDAEFRHACRRRLAEWRQQPA